MWDHQVPADLALVPADVLRQLDPERRDVARGARAEAEHWNFEARASKKTRFHTDRMLDAAARNKGSSCWNVRSGNQSPCAPVTASFHIDYMS